LGALTNGAGPAVPAGGVDRGGEFTWGRTPPGFSMPPPGRVGGTAGRATGAFGRIVGIGAGLAKFGAGRGVGATGRNDGTGAGRLKEGAGLEKLGAGRPPPLPIWAGVSPGSADKPIATAAAVNVIPRMG
jgi:hypothetical protein